MYIKQTNKFDFPIAEFFYLSLAHYNGSNKFSPISMKIYEKLWKYKLYRQIFFTDNWFCRLSMCSCEIIFSYLIIMVARYITETNHRKLFKFVSWYKKNIF